MIILLLNQVAPGNVEKRRVTQQPTPGQELEDIPDGFDSRAVLLGQSTQSACFVIKDVSQILPYCVINLTRHPQTRMLGSLRTSSPSVTMSIRNLPGSSLPGPSSAQPANTAGPSSSAAFPTNTSSGQGLSGPQLPTMQGHPLVELRRTYPCHGLHEIYPSCLGNTAVSYATETLTMQW